MREPNFSSITQNRAAVVVSSTLYDRRALDCTATLPLVNSLTHLAYMTSTSPRIREILATDGGLERLVNVLATCRYTDKHSLWKWSLAFQCVVNVGVRGTEATRTRVVEAGAVHIVLAILENFIQAIDQAKLDKDQEKKQQRADDLVALTSAGIESSRSTPTFLEKVETLDPTELETDHSLYHPTFVIPKRHTFLQRTAKPKTKPYTASLSSIPFLNNLSTDVILNREEDILLSLQLLAYLSKYPQIRQAFHCHHRHNVFSVVEKFTHRIHPAAIIYWAGVIMRNACRKDEANGGIRQCANMHCGKWERVPREFAKCRRCRKAKYCSKTCQSKAWSDGHRWWCVERLHSSHPPATSSTTAAATAAVAAAAPPPPPPTEQVVHLEDATSDVMPIPVETNTEPVTNEGNTARENDTSRSLLTNETNLRPTREQELLFYHHTQRRNPRLVHSLASGSSTEVEGDTETSRPRDLMDVD
ncbi:hypothetical protein BY458DRAFT_431657 [Sporodiniella umbellata]|nr:hypothetical protein BY458DRAFT_431657 [Sporodiniella umbellata]